MSIIAKLLTRKTFAACSMAQQAITNCGIRSIFSDNYFDAELFKKYKKTVKRESGKNKETLRTNIVTALAKPDANLFTEDLQKWLYLSETDEDIDLLVNGILKYQKQDPDIYAFHFETPLLKLLYFSEKIDRALAIYEKNPQIAKTFKCNLMIMNKLVAEKRFDEAVAFGEEVLKIVPQDGKNGIGLFSNIIMLLAESLGEQNTKEALEKLKKILSSQPNHTNRAIKNAFILAINQNDPHYAKELLKMFQDSKKIVVKKNLEVIILVKLGRVQEAVDQFKNLVGNDQTNFVYKYAVDTIQEAVKNEPNLKNMVDDLIPKVRYTRLDLQESAKNIIEAPQIDTRFNGDFSRPTFRDSIRKPFGENSYSKNGKNYVGNKRPYPDSFERIRTASNPNNFE